MGEDTGEGRPGVDAAGQADEQRSPDEIRRDIDQTRVELGDTVEALAEKADVKGQVKDKVSGLKQTAQQKKDEFVSNAKASSPESATESAQRATQKAQENPLPFAVGGAFAAGFLIGRLTSR